MLKKLTYGLLLMLLPFTGWGDMLWWLVNETATVDGMSLVSFIEPYAWEEDGYSGYDVGARVKVTFNDGTSTVLPIYNNGQYWDYSSFDESGDGRGISTGNWASQSPVNISSEMFSEALFQIQLGSLSYSEALDLFIWDETIAESNTATINYLREHYIWEGGVWPPADGQWTPTDFYTYNPPFVPEPSSSLLFLIGVSLLLLKRNGTC